MRQSAHGLFTHPGLMMNETCSNLFSWSTEPWVRGFRCTNLMPSLRVGLNMGPIEDKEDEEGEDEEAKPAANAVVIGSVSSGAAQGASIMFIGELGSVVRSQVGPAHLTGLLAGYDEARLDKD